jgi:5,10-methylenetetrahydromethanopterin reductase
MIKLGIAILGDDSPIRSASTAKTAERCGFDYVWVADESPTPPYRDVFVTLAKIASETRKVRIGTGICNPYTRNPALLAIAISTIDEICKNRSILGVGPGGSLSLKPLKIRQWDRPLTAVRETVSICRTLFDGKTSSFDGELFKTNNVSLFKTPRKPIPIYVGAYGTKMLELAGEIADGIITTAPLGYMQHVLDRIRVGAEKARRQVDRIDIANWIPLSLSRNDKKARRIIQRDLTYVIADYPPRVLESIGVSQEEASAIRNRLKEGVIEAAKLVSDEIIESCSITGTPTHCAEKILEYEASGVKQMILGPPFGANTVQSIGTIKKEIIPALKSNLRR